MGHFLLFFFAASRREIEEGGEREEVITSSYNKRPLASRYPGNLWVTCQ